MDTFHTHDSVEIMYVISGSCLINVEGIENKFKKGDFILIDAEVPHKLVVDKDNPCRMLNIEFAFKETQNILPSIKDLINNSNAISSMFEIKCNYFILKDNDEVYQALKNLIMELNSDNGKDEFSIQLFLIEVFVKISKLIVMNYGNATTNMHINKTINFINMNYDRDLSVKELSLHINVNEDYLHRIFKQHTGVTIIEFLTSMRMEKAKMLLKNTDIPIIDVSGYVGINSRQYFSYVFKKNTGISPNQFRKSQEVKSYEY
jgi:AraC-like DNA-binding protein